MKSRQEKRERIADFLVDAIAGMIGEYESFLASQSDAETSREFSARQAGLKAAIGNIEKLLQLNRWLNESDPLRNRAVLEKLQQSYAQEARKDVVAGLRRIEDADSKD